MLSLKTKQTKIIKPSREKRKTFLNPGSYPTHNPGSYPTHTQDRHYDDITETYILNLEFKSVRNS